MTSCARPISGPPISSQARDTPTRKQITTRIAIAFTSPASLAAVPGPASKATPSIIWTTKTTASPTRNSPSRTTAHRTWCRRISDSSDAATNVSPTAATTTVATPIFCPGISANSDTASALMNAVSAADARMRWSCAPDVAGPAFSEPSRPAATEMATNSRPISVPATPALATKKSWMLSGTIR